MGMSASVRQIGCDCHRRFSTVTARDEHNRVVWRERRTNDHLVVSTQKSAIATEGSAGLRQFSPVLCVQEKRRFMTDGRASANAWSRGFIREEPPLKMMQLRVCAISGMNAVSEASRTDYDSVWEG